MKYYDLFSFILSLITAFYTIKQKAIRWPMDMAIILINLAIHHRLRLYDRWILTFGIIILDIYGWLNWRNKEKQKNYRIEKLNFKNLISISVFSLVGFFIFHFFLKSIHSDFPFLGSIRIVLTWVAIWLTTQKKQENWILWILLNFLAIYVYYKKNYFLFIIKYFVYTLLNIYAIFEWKKHLKG